MTAATTVTSRLLRALTCLTTGHAVMCVQGISAVNSIGVDL
jgi:hypothetical protein